MQVRLLGSVGLADREGWTWLRGARVRTVLAALALHADAVVALARSLMRADADLLLLDEPSSGLDPIAEHHIRTMLRRVRRGRTTLMISHRLAALRDADLIVVLADGVIVERGPHADLVAAGGGYADMFHLQAAGYAA